MKIIKAEHLGMCFGVRDAIQLALEAARRQPLTILGELVHNRTVLEQLRREGVEFASEPGRLQTQTVMITAHGAAERTRSELRAGGYAVMEATCPLVHFAHRSLHGLVREGYYPVIIGQRAHVEVRGLTGDLEDFEVVLSEADVWHLSRRERFGIVAQTTQPIGEVERLVDLIQRRFPESEVRFIDTVCQPTKQRQTAAVELARQAELVLVIGGANSNNTRQLVATCARYCGRVHHVQSARDLKEEWFREISTVGITAGTSTPASLIEEVDAWIRKRFCEPPARPAPLEAVTA